ncbi:MAG: tetratricopeptide repeat protein [Acidobacteria bacterium]|nr:tetratricopeptide repeat protein [Acidobacteriota bacterium]
MLQYPGESEEARDLLRKALASDEKTYAAGHPTIATKQSNLALVLRNLGELEEARDLLRKAYATFLARFGPHHRSTKIVKGNLDRVGE